jgi:hypothetical protein
VHTNAVGDTRSVRALFFPSAGSLPGAGGLFFRSDVTLVNYGPAPRTVLVAFWPAGTSNPPTATAGANSKIITLPANQSTRFIDVVASVLNLQGVGSLLVIPVAGSNFDGSGAIDGFSRIYTKQPGSNGTVSQPFDAVDPDTFSAPLVDEAVALGLRQDADFRTNFGIVNVDDKDRIFKVTFIGEKLTTSTTVTVKGFGMIQQGIPAGDYGALQIVYQVTNAGSDFVTWVGYASSTDNISGDGWVSLASADLTPDELDLIGY